MAIDPRISLMSQAPNLQSSIRLFDENLNNIQNRKMNAQNMAQSAELQPLRVQQAQQSVDAGQMQANQQKVNQNLQSIATYAPTLRGFLKSGDTMGAAQSLNQRIEFLERNGRDATESREALQAITTGNPDDVLQALDIAEREAAARGLIGGGQELTAGQRERESLINDLQSSDPNIRQSARVALKLDPIPTSSAQERIAQDQNLTQQVASSQSAITESVETVKQDIKTRGEGKSAAIKAAVNQAATEFPKIANVQSTINNYDSAIAELDAGANTGTIYSKVPSLNAAGKRLDNIIKNLGLNVVGSTTFGALSESELDFALRAAIPDNLPPKELREWLVAKKTAQQKLLNGLNEFVSFTGSGEKTLADWKNRNALQKFSTEGGQGQPTTQSTVQPTGQPAGQNRVIRFDSQGNIIQ